MLAESHSMRGGERLRESSKPSVRCDALELVAEFGVEWVPERPILSDAIETSLPNERLLPTGLSCNGGGIGGSEGIDVGTFGRYPEGNMKFSSTI